MRYLALLKKKVSGREWYHQRFDGSPFYLFAIGASEIKKERRKPAGTEADVRVCFFHGQKADWYLDMADVGRGSNVIIRLAKKHPYIATKLLKAWEKDEQAFQKYFDGFDPRKLRRLDDDALAREYLKYFELFTNRYTSSAIIDHFALGTDRHVADMLRKEVGALAKESAFTEIFSVATAPVHQSFINESEMQLLRIAMKRKPSKKELEDYQKKYFWIHNNYFSAHTLSVNFFQKEIAQWKKSGVDLKKKYRQLLTTRRVNARAKAALFKRYRLSRLLRTLLKVSEDFTWWQDERKKSTFLNIYMGMQILGEMARRKKVDAKLTKYLLPIEVTGWFMGNAVSTEELRKRQKGCCVVMWDRGYVVASSTDVARVKELMFGNKRKDEVRDIRGLSACVGRVVGPVKIVGSVREVGKITKGDILVAVMTRPDYIAGIKKAAAIVTNEGGITCHAAIVSRELGIPCIIGTKIATEVLKDGDIVEVNANHGVITVVKRR